MIQVYKYDSNGNYVEPMMIDVDENGNYQLPENCTDISLPQPNYNLVFNGTNWVEMITDEELVAKYSPSKIQELNDMCNQTILGRFSVELDDGTYEFSYDYDAQSRFNGIASLFNSDLITEIPWTAYLNGERLRITLTKDNFNKVALAALTHCNDNIIKYNNLLEDLKKVTNLDSLNGINW